MDFSTLVLISITLTLSGMDTTNVLATPIPQVFYPNGVNRPIYPPPVGNFPPGYYPPGVYPVNNLNVRPIFYRRQATPMSSGQAMTQTSGAAATQPAMSTHQATVLSAGASTAHTMVHNMTGQAPTKPMTTAAHAMMPETAEGTSKNARRQLTMPEAGTMTTMPTRGAAPMMQNMTATVAHSMPGTSSTAAMHHPMAGQTIPGVAPASSTTVMMHTQPMDAAAKPMRRRQIPLSPSTSTTSTTVPATMTMAHQGVGSTTPLQTGQAQMPNGQSRQMMAGTTSTVSTQMAGVMSYPAGQMSGMPNGESQPLMMITPSKPAVTRREVTLLSTGTPALVMPHVPTQNMTALTPNMMAGQAPTTPMSLMPGTASSTTEPMQMQSPSPMSMPPMAPAKTVSHRELLSLMLGSTTPATTYTNTSNLSTSAASPGTPVTLNYMPSQNVSPSTGLPTNLGSSPVTSASPYGTARTTPATTYTPPMAASGLAAPSTGSTVGQTTYTPAPGQPPFVSTTAPTTVPAISISYLPIASTPAAVNPSTNSASNPPQPAPLPSSAVYDGAARSPVPMSKPFELPAKSS